MKAVRSFETSLTVTKTSRRYFTQQLHLQQQFQVSLLRKCNCSVDLVTLHSSKVASYSAGTGRYFAGVRRPELEADNSPPYETKNLRENGLEIPPPLPHIFTVWCVIQYEKIHFNQSSSIITVTTRIVFRKIFFYRVVPSHVYIQSIIGGPILEVKATRA